MGQRALGIAASSAALGLLVLALAVSGCRTGTGSGAPDERMEMLAEFLPGAVRVQPWSPQGQSRNAGTETVLAVEGPSGGLLGYAVELQAVSRSGPFPILVALDTQRCVRGVRILRYTADRGRAVLSHTFTSRFEGKCPQDPIRIGVDIDAVTGATLSARAVADGVRRAIELTQPAQ